MVDNLDENMEKTSVRDCLKHFCRYDKPLLNLISIGGVYVITSLNFFLLSFMVTYLKGNIFYTAGISSIAQCIGCLVGGILL